ncbi:hypothetical protein [Pseudomonas syringae]|uniref:hypothetical protein n=1 Tax=Pseudomonas syringae TaxID=317 RepID=UPI0002F9C038|nr:hypothetical protein [Pseudomonas syringae]PYD15816.1 hypothetical protein DND62_06645 [Pseudomonas syringae pv. pisi]PYD34328.1 hypothetical protein DND58_01600 [Pseudomonas syringae pv. pisi]
MSKHPIPGWLRSQFSRIEDEVQKLGPCGVFTQMRTVTQTYFEQQAEAAQPPACCTPTAEENALLAAGDYRPEELWGVGGKPSCPKCYAAPQPPALGGVSDFWAWLDKAYREGSKGEHAKFTKHNMEVAYCAGLGRSPALSEWADKTEWLRITIQPKELGMHLADVMRNRIEQLSQQLGREQNEHHSTILARDNAETVADEMAVAIGERFRVDVGEHSNMNCPWGMALSILNGEYVTDSDADRERDRLKALLSRVIDSSVLAFEQDGPEELQGLEADICAALSKPAGSAQV